MRPQRQRLLAALAACAAAVTAVAAITATPATPPNNRPIIGVLTLPCDQEPKLCGSHKSYIAASYVKFLEAGGARVAPLFYWLPEAEMRSMLSQVNGVLFTGGDAPLEKGVPYFDAVLNIVNYTISANRGGDYFPLWTTCLGFEALITAVSGNPNILSEFDAENITLPLVFTAAAPASRMYNQSRLSGADAVRILATENVTMNNHMYGVTPDDFMNNPNLGSTFRILSTNADREGRVFVSSIEAFSIPIYGTQYHAEKNVWEWWPNEVMQHTADAVFVTQFLSQFFVSETRRSAHVFNSTAFETQSLIYNFAPTFTNGAFEQCYFFD